MRVYVSSTFLDLVDCRKVVHTTLRKLRQDDVAMEHYVAESDRPVDVCLRDVRESELYIGLFAWRYGYVPDGYTQSITELEYRAAMEAEIPCLIFLLSEDAMWPRNMVDRGAAADSIEAFRADLGTRHTVAFFGNAQELGTAVATAVSRHLVENSDIPDQVRLLDSEMVRQYFERLHQQYGRLDLDALTPPEREEYLQIRLESVFVEQYVREDPPPVEVPRELLQRLLAQGEIDEDELPDGFDVARLREAQEAYRAKPQVKVIEALQGTERCVVILGNPGSGKSTLARFLMLSLAGLGEHLGPLTGHLPLLVELKRYVAMRGDGLCQSIVGFLDHLWDAQGLGVAYKELEPYLAAGGPALAVFDGLDEVFDPRRREEIANEIAAFAVRRPSVRIVVTSRSAGYRRSLLTNAGFRHFTLQDLDEDQIAEFLRSWYSLALNDRPDQAAERQARLLRAVRESRPISELAGNPLLLTILAIIGKHQALPRERWKVYDHATRVLVQHWDVNRQLQETSPVAQYIGEDDKREMLRRIAWLMQTAEAGKAGNFIHREELLRTFEEYLTERYASDPSTAKLLASRMIDQFRERNFILSRYGPHLYGFVHRAFLEFFCADSIVQRFQRLQVMPLDELAELFGAHAHDSEWREVLRLLASVLAEHHTSTVIERLLRLDRPWPTRVFEQRLPQGLALAAECLAEVGNPRAVESASAVLNEIVLLLEHCVGIEDERSKGLLESNIIPAARTIGTAWPDRDAFVAWYERRGCRIVWSPISTYIARLAAIVLADRPAEISPLFVAADINDRRARGAIDGGIEELVSSSSRSTAPGVVHAEAARAVGELSDHMFERLKDFTTASRDRLRLLGVVLLDKFAPDDSRVTAVLRDRLRHESDDDVFRAVAEALLRRFPRDPEIREIVLEKAMAGGDLHRRDMIVALAKEHWPDDPGFWVFLVVLSSSLFSPEVAVDVIARLPSGVSVEAVVDSLVVITGGSVDGSGYRYVPRYNAVVLLDLLAPDDSRVTAVLRDRLRRESDDDVFRAVAEALLRRFPRDPEVRKVVLEKAMAGAGVAGEWFEMLSDLGETHWPDDLEVRMILAAYSTELLGVEAAADVIARLPSGAPVRMMVDLLLAVVGGESGGSDLHSFRHNAVVLLDELASDDSRVTAVLRDRLRRESDDDVFRAVAEALLRRFPRDPEVHEVILGKVRSGLDSRWGWTIADIAGKYWADDPDLWAVSVAFSSDLLGVGMAADVIAKLPSGASVEAVVGALLAMIDDGAESSDSGSYICRHNAVVLLDELAPDDSRVTAVLRDRLRHESDDDVFRAAAGALLRRFPRDLEVREAVLGHARVGITPRWSEMLSGHIQDHWLGDPELGVLLGLLSAEIVGDEVAAGAVAGLASSASVETVVDTLLRKSHPDLSVSKPYRLPDNARILFDALFREHPQTGAILRARLLDDDLLEIFPAVAEALLRRHPGDPQVRQSILDRAMSKTDEYWRDVLYDLARENWPDDPAFEMLQDGGMWGDVRRRVSTQSVDMAQLAALDRPGPQDLPIDGFTYF